MTGLAGTAAILFLIVLMFVFDRDEKVRTSKALWLPIIWLSIIASRPVSSWLESMGLVRPQAFSVDVYVDGSPIDRNVYLLLMILGIGVLAGRKEQVRSLLKRNLPLALYLAYCVISFSWADYPVVSAKRWIKSLGDVAMVAIVLTDPYPAAAVKQLLRRVGFLLVPLSVLFVKFFPELGREYNPWTWEPMFVGVGMQKNGLGTICLIFGLGYAWRLISTYQDKDKDGRVMQMVVHSIFLAMVVWLLWKSDSMTSLSCLLIGLAGIGAGSIRSIARKPILVHTMAIALVGLVFTTLFLSVSGILGMLGRDPTLTGRTDIWDATLSLVERPLIGTGYENFWLGERYDEVARIVNNNFTQAHNGYIEVYLNLGWIGAILVVNFMLWTYWSTTRALLRNPEARLWLAYCLVFIVYNFTEGAVKMTNPMMFVFLLAMMDAARPVRANERVRVRVVGRRGSLSRAHTATRPRVAAASRVLSGTPAARVERVASPAVVRGKAGNVVYARTSSGRIPSMAASANRPR